MSQNHYSTKAKRRNVSKSRVKQSQKRIAGTMAELKRRGQIGKPDEKMLADLAAIKDEDIDTSDIPEVKDWSGAEIGKFYRG